jgi:PAS domain S-box-containing protein
LPEASLSEQALILAPLGRDADIAAKMLGEAGIVSRICRDLPALRRELEAGAGFGLITEEALAQGDLRPVAAWLGDQPEWSDFPFVLLTHRGGGLERNPSAARHLRLLGNVAFLERPFHPTTLVSLGEAALRGRRRQYDARRRLEMLRDSERQFRTLADSIPTLCWSAGPDGAIDWYNKRWYAYTGAEPADMKGWGWQSVHDPEMLPSVLEAWKASIATGQPFEMVFPLRSADGRFRPFLTRAQPVRDATGASRAGSEPTPTSPRNGRPRPPFVGLRTSWKARVEQRTAEREAAQDALRQAQKMEAIGQLTGGVAHDFNNLLTVIRGSVELLRREGLPEQKRQRYIDAIGTTADRAAKLTSQLLAFSRRQALTPELFEIGESLAEVTGIVRTLIGSRVDLTFVEPSEPTYVLSDRGQFDTAIVNMAVNARDAMGGEGSITVRTRAVSGIPAVRGHAAVEGPFIAVTIADTGSGIAADQVDRIFEPFFTTKPVGEGTGLGLSQVIGFAKQSGGDIQVESEIGRGTTFTLYLPRADGTADGVVGAPQPEPHSEGKGACVLVVEDNEQVGAFATEALKELGYDSVLAPDGARALAELETAGDRFQVVFSDVVMPGMSGIDLADQVRRLHPHLPVVLASGYSHVLAQPGSHGFELLHKPYSIEQLSRVLQKAIG